MNATQDALAHRFLAATRAEVATWPPELQVALHEYVFLLPELVLAQEPDAAIRWVKRWRDEMDSLPAPAPATTAAVEPWIEELARDFRPLAEMDVVPPSAEQLERLAELFARFGPLALSIPWRFEPVKA